MSVNASPISVVIGLLSRSLCGSGLLRIVEEVVVAPERDREHDPEHDDARDQPIAQLGQVLDERGLLAVVEPADARQPREEPDHGG